MCLRQSETFPHSAPWLSASYPMPVLSNGYAPTNTCIHATCIIYTKDVYMQLVYYTQHMYTCNLFAIHNTCIRIVPTTPVYICLTCIVNTRNTQTTHQVDVINACIHTTCIVHKTNTQTTHTTCIVHTTNTQISQKACIHTTCKVDTTMTQTTHTTSIVDKTNIRGYLTCCTLKTHRPKVSPSEPTCVVQ